MAHKKRTRTQKDMEDMEDDIENDIEDITDSEEDYTETEKRLLEKVRKQRINENFDSDDEVYGLQDNSDEEEEEEDDQRDSMESDVEGMQEDYDMPNDRAWGNKAKTFYSSDFKYTDYSSAPQKDLANADMEEEEGKRLHMRAMGQHVDLDSLDFLRITETTDDSKDDQKDSKQVSDKESFMLMVNTFKECMIEAKDRLAPFLELVKDGTCPDCDAVAFVKIKYQVLLNYCINISFCLMLKAKGLPVKSHPVVKRVAQYRQLLDQLQSEQGNLLEQVEEIMKAVKEGKPLYSVSDGSEIQTKPNKKTAKRTSLITKLTGQKMSVQDKQEQLPLNNMGEEDMDTEEKYDDETMNNEKDNIILDVTNEEEGKRAITYQMAKNRGLTPYRKKELRNPRVKHRNKYRKAKIRRKGAIREVRKELTRYEGEISGIKAGVKKGIKLK